MQNPVTQCGQNKMATVPTDNIFKRIFSMIGFAALILLKANPKSLENTRIHLKYSEYIQNAFYGHKNLNFIQRAASIVGLFLSAWVVTGQIASRHE